MCFDSLGMPHVTYQMIEISGPGEGDSHSYLRVAVREQNSWAIEELDADFYDYEEEGQSRGGWTGRFPSIECNPSDTLGVSYLRLYDGDPNIHVEYRDRQDGAWLTPLTVTDSAGSESHDLAFNVEGNPTLAFIDPLDELVFADWE